MPTVTVQVDGTSASTTITVTPPAGTIRWKADAELPLSQEWAEYSTPRHCAVDSTGIASDPNAFQQSAVVAKGARAYEFILNPGDIQCYGGRAEIGQDLPTRTGFSESRRFSQGDDLWFSFQVLLGVGFPVSTTYGQLINQLSKHLINSGPNSSPEIAFGVRFGSFQLQIDAGATEQAICPAVTGRWVKFSVHVFFTTSRTAGFMDVFGDYDGAGMRHLLGPVVAPTLAADAQGRPVQGHSRIGLYRDVRILSSVPFYCDGWTVATTRAAAEANAF